MDTHKILMSMSEWTPWAVDEMGSLTDKQYSMKCGLCSVVAEYGQFDKSDGPDGAHYLQENPFEGQGIECENCVFYGGDGTCELVAGVISPDSICKLWIIPAGEMGNDNDDTPETS